VFATVNRPEILDLLPQQSFIVGLLENGLDVYLLDWGYPDKNDRNISFDEYVIHYLHRCIQFIRVCSHQEKINLLGICQGGLIALCYAALFNHTKNLILISTPIDFHTRDNLIWQLFKKIDTAHLTEKRQNMPGKLLTKFFMLLSPFEFLGKKYLRFVNNLTDQPYTNKFLQVEKWLFDAPDQPIQAFTQLVTNFYQKNQLIKGTLYLNDHQIDLAQLTMPILNIMARDDKIVPLSSSRALKTYVKSSAYAQRLFPSGHVGIYISERVGMRLPRSIANWLKQDNRG
jgi:polyhydroxyalkanoate synthase